jgi:hypothetical protein
MMHEITGEKSIGKEEEARVLSFMEMILIS